MTAVVLCPGPSLAKLPALPPCDVSLAVNRAALRFAADWWAASDYPLIKWNIDNLMGNPNLLTRRQTYIDMHDRLSRFPQIRLVEDVPGTAGLNKTMLFAAALAADLGAKRIDLYGCDMAGETDYDGAKAGEDRSEARWARERLELAELTDWLKGRGCELRGRH